MIWDTEGVLKYKRLQNAGLVRESFPVPVSEAKLGKSDDVVHRSPEGTDDLEVT